MRVPLTVNTIHKAYITITATTRSTAKESFIHLRIGFRTHELGFPVHPF